MDQSRCFQPLVLRRIGVVFLILLVIYLTVSFHLLDQITDPTISFKHSVSQLTGWPLCDSPKSANAHRLAVLVPFRDRFTELQQFLPHLHQFLNSQGVQHTFYVINQADGFKFNRGALLNVGALESQKAETVGATLRLSNAQLVAGGQDNIPCCLRPPPTDYLALHDVDLLPADQGISYAPATVRSGVHHLIPAKLHPVYQRYPAYFGGAVLVQRQHYRLLDGFSNAFWGWGLEDDDFRMRVQRRALSVTTPTNVKLGLRAFKIIHQEGLHSRDMSNYRDLRLRSVLSAARNVADGLSTANYTVLSRQWLAIDGVSALLFNVQLHCDTHKEMCQYQRQQHLRPASARPLP